MSPLLAQSQQLGQFCLQVLVADDVITQAAAIL